MSTSSSIERTPTVSELAWLFGIRDDQPDRYKSLSSDQAAIEELVSIAGTLSESMRSVLAEFLSLYLPSLLKILQECSHAPSLVDSVLRILYWATKTPQSKVGIHRLREAANLPTFLVQHFVNSPSELLVSTTPSDFFEPFRDLVLLRCLMLSAMDFGQASHCNFRLSSTLLADLSQVGFSFLSAPFVRDATSGDRSEGLSLGLSMAYGVKGAIGSILTSLNLGKYGEVDDCSAIFQCGQGAEAEEKFCCRVKSCRKVDGLNLCSKCLCVAYCSIDWKEHKLVCFKPSW